MTNNKTFTVAEINKKTNEIFINYAQHYKNGKMSFAEYTLIQNVIMLVQNEFKDEE